MLSISFSKNHFGTCTNSWVMQDCRFWCIREILQIYLVHHKLVCMRLHRYGNDVMASTFFIGFCLLNMGFFLFVHNTFYNLFITYFNHSHTFIEFSLVNNFLTGVHLWKGSLAHFLPSLVPCFYVTVTSESLWLSSLLVLCLRQHSCRDFFHLILPQGN